MKKEKNQLLPLILCCGINVALTTTNIGLCIYNRTTPPVQEAKEEIIIAETKKELSIKPTEAARSRCAGVSAVLQDAFEEAAAVSDSAIVISSPSAVETNTQSAIKVKKEKTKEEKIKKKEKTYTDDDLEVLAHVIMGEVGNQSYECKFYVGAVVLNRVKSSLYPNTIREVVFQRGQYACTWDGNYDKKPNKECYKAAKDLLENGTGDVPVTVTGQSAVTQGKIWKAIKCTNGVTCYFCHNKWVVKEYEEKEAKKKSEKN